MVPPLTDLTYFQTIPWCSTLLSDPDFTTTPTGSRQPKASTEDALFSQTLQTETTIRRCLSLYQLPPKTAGSRIKEVRTLLDLGSGLNSHPNVCHGGLIAVLIDEVMSVLLSLTRDRIVAGDNVERPKWTSTMTAFLNVTYRKPVPTPGVVLVTASLKEVTGRKYFIDSTVEGAGGLVYARAKALFLEMREKL